MIMNLKDFYEAYDLTDMDILKLYTKEDKIYLLLDCQTHLDLMGNGIRPAFDVSFHHMFIFKNNGYKFNFRKINVTKYEYKEDKIYLYVSSHEIIFDSNPEVILNYV